MRGCKEKFARNSLNSQSVSKLIAASGNYEGLKRRDENRDKRRDGLERQMKFRR